MASIGASMKRWVRIGFEGYRMSGGGGSGGGHEAAEPRLLDAAVLDLAQRDRLVVLPDLGQPGEGAARPPAAEAVGSAEALRRAGGARERGLVLGQRAAAVEAARRGVDAEPQ